MSIVIESYLTEQRLKDALQQLFSNGWLGGQVALPDSRRRFDMAFRSNGLLLPISELARRAGRKAGHAYQKGNYCRSAQMKLSVR
ncbi:MAG: hypothetical protein HY781_06305 [Chloroflexi bacterium]|nr:hypothetical protein [Chloroflexota bacterium]